MGAFVTGIIFRRSSAALAAFLFLFMALALPASAADDAANCLGNFSEPANVRLAACDAVIASGQLKGSDLALAYFQRGRIILESREKLGGLLDPAERTKITSDFSEAIRTVPSYSKYLYYDARGDLYQRDNFDPRRAISDYSQAIAQKSDDIDGLSGRALSYASLKEYDRAIADYTKLIATHPMLAPIYVGKRASVYAKKGDYDRAIADATEELKIGHPFFPAIKFYRRAMIYEAKGDFSHAASDYDEQIRMDPNSVNNAQNYYRRGIANFYGGAKEQGLADLDKAFAMTLTWDANLKKAAANNQIAQALWLEIVARRQGQPSRLPQIESQLDMTAGLAPLVRMFLGQISPESLLTDATFKPFACDINLRLFVAEYSLVTGARDEAIRHLRAFVIDCDRPPSIMVTEGDFGWVHARAELKALGAAP